MTYIPTLDMTLFFESVPFVLQGLPYTILISLLSFLFGNIIGLILTTLSMVKIKPLTLLIRFYISFLRGTPGIVLLFILYFGLPIQLHPVVAAIICFSLSSSAFLVEIYRGAIYGVDKGQWEAATALGLPFLKIMQKIILPQAMRLAIPSLGNVAVDILKGSSLAAMITVPDIFQKAKIVGGREFDFLTMYLLVACIYWILCLLINFIQQRLEKRFNQFYQQA